MRPPARRALFCDERRRREEKGGEFEGANALALLVDAAAVDANMMISFFFVSLCEKVWRLFGFSGYEHPKYMFWHECKTVSRKKNAREREREREMPLAKATHDRVRPQSFLSLSLSL